MIGTATVVGVALGCAVAVIAKWVSRRLGPGDFWKSLPELTRQLASQSETDEFLKAYGKLLRGLGGYLFRNTVQLVASFAPVAATVILAGPAVMELYNRGATELTVHPPRSLTIADVSGSPSTNAGGTAFTPVPEFEGTQNVTAEAGVFPYTNPRHNQSWCTTPWGGLGMALLGFETHEATEATNFLILRPHRGDFTPFWPYLNDLEFFFYLAIATASGVTALIMKAKKL